MQILLYIYFTDGRHTKQIIKTAALIAGSNWSEREMAQRRFFIADKGFGFGSSWPDYRSDPREKKKSDPDPKETKQDPSEHKT